MTELSFTTTTNQTSYFKIEAKSGHQVVGRIYLYLIHNDLHSQPYGLIEDLFVLPQFRHQGIGSHLLQLAIEKAKQLGCYKLIGTSRFRRPKIHRLYQTKFHFKKHGYEFRLDL